jgi:capsular polysaccharide biosynthesis protein
MQPARPRILYILILGALAGLALAFTVCLLWELSDERFSLPEQVTSALKVPVLASFGDADSAQRQGAR